ncbi:MAG: sulfatase-like hydrolase/transferase [Acidobacteriia bacterium]|nr:sulfatase-like hydrolase/transferase [Terriglobia bacterium]
MLLVTIDTVRADHIGCYGATSVKTPTIDALAKDGVLFERALSQVPLTWPSHVAILTGTYPFHNGVQDFSGQPLAADFRSIAQAFADHGYATAAVISSFVLNRSWGLARGFAHYDDAFAGNAFLETGVGLVERKAEESVNHSLAWLNHRPAKPFFFWLHLYDPHSGYDPPEPFRSEYHDHLYDGEIAYADAQLGRVIAWLKQNHLYDNTIIVVLSDHGESLGEHGEREHGFFIYNATLHVPLVIKPAGGAERGRRLDDVAEITAVAPTLLKLAGISDRISAQFDTAPLLPKPRLDAAYSETFYPFSSFGWNPLRSVETSDFHYIEAPRPELYNLRSDPRELHNLFADQPATAAALKQRLSERVARAPSQAPGTRAGADDAVTEKLRALGYLAYRSPVPASALDKPLPDPKDKIQVLEAILQASDAFRAGKPKEGEALLRQVLEKDPDLYVVPFMIGEEALDRKEWAEATTQLEKALQLNPEFDQAMTAVARSLHEQGRDEDAEKWVKKAIEKNSRNFRAWYELGWIQARGKPKEALVALHKTIEIQPNFALAYRDIGMIEFQARDYAQAAQHLQQAVDLGLSKPVLLNYLGIAYSQTGQLEKAVASYRAALQQMPDLAEAHLNLGFAYERLQQGARAAQEYATACRLDVKLCNPR